LFDRSNSGRIGVDNLPQDKEEFPDVADRSVQVDMPSLLLHSLVLLTIKFYINVDGGSYGSFPIGHLDENLISESNETTHVSVTVDFWEFGVGVVDDMFSLELGSVFIETVGDEHWYVVEPSISWSR
jgi:hypothetical protein